MADNIGDQILDLVSDANITNSVSAMLKDVLRDSLSAVIKPEGITSILQQAFGSVAETGTITGVGNLLGRIPMLNSFTGVQDSRIPGIVASNIAQRDYGMMSAPSAAINSYTTALNVRSFTDTFTASNPVYAANLNNGNYAMIANYLNAAGTINSQAFANMRGLSDKDKAAMTSASEVASIGKNILGFGDDVYKSLNMATLLGGTRNFEDNTKKFKDYLNSMIKTGLSLAEIQTTMSTATQDISQLLSLGYTPNIASAIVRESSFAAAAAAKNARAENRDFNISSEANKLKLQTLITSETSVGKESTAALLSIQQAYAAGEIDEATANNLYARIGKGDLSAVDEIKNGRSRMSSVLSTHQFNAKSMLGALKSPKALEASQAVFNNITLKDLNSAFTSHISQVSSAEDRASLERINQKLQAGQFLTEQDRMQLSNYGLQSYADNIATRLEATQFRENRAKYTQGLESVLGRRNIKLSFNDQSILSGLTNKDLTEEQKKKAEELKRSITTVSFDTLQKDPEVRERLRQELISNSGLSPKEAEEFLDKAINMKGLGANAIFKSSNGSALEVNQAGFTTLSSQQVKDMQSLLPQSVPNLLQQIVELVEKGISALTGKDKADKTLPSTSDKPNENKAITPTPNK